MLVIGVLIGLAVGIAAGALALVVWQSTRRSAAVRRSREIVAEAERDADAIRREIQIEAREERVKLRAEIEREVEERRKQILRIEERILAREAEMETKLTELTRREQGLSDRETHARQLQDDLKETKTLQVTELE